MDDNNKLGLEELRESFSKIYDGPDRLQREYEILKEAERLNIPIDTYRRLYELRSEEPIEPYPKPKHWRQIPKDWAKWYIHLPRKKKLTLLRKGSFWLIRQTIVITAVVALGRYFWEAPKREKQAHYQAWQIINSAKGQRTNAGRINALQDLNNDGVSLRGLDANQAYLERINLANAYLRYANFKQANVSRANLSKANLNNSDLSYSNLTYSNFTYADLNKANLSYANLVSINLSKANLQYTYLYGADLSDANLSDVENLTPEQVKQAKNWEKAKYSEEFRKQLGLPPEPTK
ncbi:pentapeptide repeat-containing protein [Nostoc linckia FACHB-104]|nr:pentapeptide repeat-containing protein [Nostoc linckia FACHB-104]